MNEDRIVCPSCGANMTVLFRTAVCDRCNPPNGAVIVEWWEEISLRPLVRTPWSPWSPPKVSDQVEESRHVVLLSKADVDRGKFGEVLFLKKTVNTMGVSVLNHTQRLSAPCLRNLYDMSIHRSHPTLEKYFYRFPNRYDQVAFLMWKKV